MWVKLVLEFLNFNASKCIFALKQCFAFKGTTEEFSDFD